MFLLSIIYSVLNKLTVALSSSMKLGGGGANFPAPGMYQDSPNMYFLQLHFLIRFCVYYSKAGGLMGPKRGGPT